MCCLGQRQRPVSAQKAIGSWEGWEGGGRLEGASRGACLEEFSSEWLFSEEFSSEVTIAGFLCREGGGRLEGASRDACLKVFLVFLFVARLVFRLPLPWTQVSCDRRRSRR